MEHFVIKKIVFTSPVVITLIYVVYYIFLALLHTQQQEIGALIEPALLTSIFMVSIGWPYSVYKYLDTKVVASLGVVDKYIDFLFCYTLLGIFGFSLYVEFSIAQKLGLPVYAEELVSTVMLISILSSYFYVLSQASRKLRTMEVGPRGTVGSVVVIFLQMFFLPLGIWPLSARIRRF